MLNLPSDPIAIELGMARNDAIKNVEAWTSEAIRLGDLCWHYCDVRDWTALELTFSGIKIMREDDSNDMGMGGCDG